MNNCFVRDAAAAKMEIGSMTSVQLIDGGLAEFDLASNETCDQFIYFEYL